MKLGILGIETDVLYQWRNLVPTIEKKLTPISDIVLTNVKTNKVEFISRILGQKELPIENITLINAKSDTINQQPYIHENVKNFNFED